MSVKLLSLDSSTRVTGYAVFANGKLKKHGEITPTTKDNTERFNNMLHSIWQLLEKEKPQIVVIERMHQIRNVDAFRKLCEIMGAVHMWCVLNGCEYVPLSPAEWRKLAKDGDEKLPRKSEELKKWSIERTKALFCFEPKSDNEADGVLIGYGYISQF